MLYLHGGILKCCCEGPHIESVIKKVKSYGYLPSDFENVHTLVESMESKLFDSVPYNTNHILHQQSSSPLGEHHMTFNVHRLRR